LKVAELIANEKKCGLKIKQCEAECEVKMKQCEAECGLKIYK
jgi:hypothetical protein